MRKFGKKLEMYHVDGYDDVEIRFISQDSIFYAEFMDKEFREDNLNSLKKKLDELAEAKKQTTWKPVILIDFDIWNNDSKPYNVEKRLLGTTIYPDGKIEKFLAHVTTDWSKGHNDDNSDDWESCFPHNTWKEDEEERKIIDYTLEKYNLLKFIIQRIDDLKEQIGEIIRSDNCESFIANLNQNNFLQIESKK